MHAEITFEANLTRQTVSAIHQLAVVLTDRQDVWTPQGEYRKHVHCIAMVKVRRAFPHRRAIAYLSTTQSKRRTRVKIVLNPSIAATCDVPCQCHTRLSASRTIPHHPPLAVSLSTGGHRRTALQDRALHARGSVAVALRAMGPTVFGFLATQTRAPERRDVHVGYLAGSREERRGAVDHSVKDSERALFSRQETYSEWSIGFSGSDGSKSLTNLCVMDLAASQDICWPLPCYWKAFSGRASIPVLT